VAPFLRRLERLMPDLYAALDGARPYFGGPGAADALDRAYATAPTQAIEYGVIERTREVVVIPARFRWSDIGSWGELLQVLDKDPEGNAVRGEHVGIDTRGSLVYGGQRMVATIGVSDLLVIDTPDALLICARGRAQDVKHVVELLRASGRADLV
jgi:mannose-1-phosphate guanylyltransferase